MIFTIKFNKVNRLTANENEAFWLFAVNQTASIHDDVDSDKAG